MSSALEDEIRQLRAESRGKVSAASSHSSSKPPPHFRNILENISHLRGIVVIAM